MDEFELADLAREEELLEEYCTHGKFKGKCDKCDVLEEMERDLALEEEAKSFSNRLR